MAVKKEVNVLQLFAAGFALIILIGAVLLWLPIGNRSGISFFDALFTSTSATCVTGLVVHDTATEFTLFGQIVIIILIQIGGLGFMTIIGGLSMILGRRIGLRERSFLMESSSSMQLGGVVRLIKRILICTFICEFTGALLLSIRFIPRFGWGTGVWYSIFHSISAFCNAGFDLMGVIEPYCSLVPFVSDALVNLTVASLILVGGIGFIVWNDLIDNGFHFRKYKLHSKIVLVSSAILIVGGTILFALIEWNGSLSGLSVGGKLLASLFQAITPRTAGFNTVDLASLSSAGKVLTMLLMLIGGGAGSTAGGLKISTITVIILSALAYARRREDADAFGKRIAKSDSSRAYASALLYLSVVLVGFFVVSLQGLSFSDSLFEVFSAIGTVGLSTGITRQFNTVSRIMLILMMYCGRLGSMSVAMAATRSTYRQTVRLPEERIIIG